MKRVQIRKVARLGTGHTPSRSVEKYWDPAECAIPWLTLADVWQLRDGSISVVHQTKEKISPLGLANSAAVRHPAGSVAFSRTASVGFSCILGVDMATSQDFVTWTCGPKLDPRYLLWALRAERADILRRTQGSTHKTIYMPDIEQLTIPLRPLDEQRSIVEYLDEETSRLDELLAKKRRLRQLLYERRRSRILDAAEGAASAAPRCPSNSIPWIRSRPSHWREVKLSLVARLGSGHTPSRSRPEWWEDCDIPWVTTGEVSQLRDDRLEILQETREMISQVGVANSSARVHPAGTVLLSRTAASAGYSAIMGRDMATSQDIATWTCGDQLRPRFLLLCLRAMRADLLGRLAMGSTHKTIYMPDISGIRVPLPPVDEQDRIVEWAWGELRQVDSMMTALDEQIELLIEHRYALAYETISGTRSAA
ncbi:MAG: type restriction enzyme subunit [Actinomycetota bacterium]|nr:type restriction enzyme subunit [Actinomycetota bacterium]